MATTMAQECEARGVVQGVAEGLRRALLRVIENRFGSVPESLKSRISSADAATLESWLERALDAASPDEIERDSV